eukprot:gnl/Dysnectes_brevis/106_a127_6740.p1 GENE.gnl/Dysnectes_brevis/106_a127_6740~~gnl/Dysnectes_brevis/106_a127_6740.p1  ORF type:complete len:370 (+),score=111.22 gnl/Dysnectes_brevis/106_a127_6740:45-1154(+)
MGYNDRGNDRGGSRGGDRGGFRGGAQKPRFKGHGERGGDRRGSFGGDRRGSFGGKSGGRGGDRGGRPSGGRGGFGGRGGGRPGGDRGGRPSGGRGGFGDRGGRPGGRGGFGDRGGKPGGRGGPRDGPRGMKGGSRVLLEPHKSFPGIYISRGKTDSLLTKSMAPGTAVYNEKRVQIEEGPEGAKVEYREWNPYRSKLGAAVRLGVSLMPIKPGQKVLYLGAASGTTVSHVSDIVGPTGAVYAVEFSPRTGRDLMEVAKNRSNIFPIVADARHPYKYRMVVPMVDTIFSDVAQPDQARIVADNAKHFLKVGGGMLISIKASSVNSVATPEAVFQAEMATLKKLGFKLHEKLDIDEFHRFHAIISGTYKHQ